MPLTQPTRADACTRKTRKPKPAVRLLPGLSASADDVDFWLTAWARSLAISEALDAHANAIWSRPRTSKLLCAALSAAVFSSQLEAADSLKHVKTFGGLLFAFVGTTKLQQVAA